MDTQHCIDICNRLLRGERSAVETYDKALEKYGDESAAIELSRIRDEHAEAVSSLEKNVRSMGGEPDHEAGAWGAFANTVQQSANLLGENSAIESLQTGEKTGRNDYEKALDDDDVMTDCKELIRSRLLPRIDEHISTLEQLQKAA
jgi:uncharacterized protein (TIGR02284 family)